MILQFCGLKYAFTSSSDVLIKIGRAICAMFDLVLLWDQFNNTLLVYKLRYYSLNELYDFLHNCVAFF